MPMLHSIEPIWPFMLWGLALVPLLVLGYVRLNRRAHLARAGMPRWSASAEAAAPRVGFWRRHGLALWMLVGLTLLLLALARPRAIVLLPSRMDTVMLAIDTSGSMRANDVSPSRFEAAQAVARQFIERQPPFVKLGVVSMSGTAALVQSPTDDREVLLRALEHLPLQTGSALGSGLLISLAQLVPGSGLNVEKLLNPESYQPNPNLPREHPANRPATPRTKLTPGSQTSSVIVLLTDGESNVGPELLDMAQVSADFGVRVFTIGFGTPKGTILKSEGVQARVKLDEAQLKLVAEKTRGEYFQAASAADIDRIYDALSLRIVLQRHQQTEVTAVLLALGLAWLLAGGAWGLVRQGRLV